MLIQEQLEKFGLNKAQALIFAFLLENGENKAIDIFHKTNLPRGVVYKALDELIALGLAKKREKKGEISRFLPAHPTHLEMLLEKNEKEAQQNRVIFQEMLPNLISGYNLTQNRPGIQIFEGREGLEKIMFDNLNSSEAVRMLINYESFKNNALFDEINRRYKKRRLRVKTKKRVLRVGKKWMIPKNIDPKGYAEITTYRYVTKIPEPFKAVVHIYDNKTSFLIMEKEIILGILIQDKNIYELNKFWFELLWETGKESLE